jgi:hypothetical protein
LPPLAEASALRFPRLAAHATSSAHAVTAAQHFMPRHCWQALIEAMSWQKLFGRGSQIPASNDDCQMHGIPAAQSLPTAHDR